MEELYSIMRDLLEVEYNQESLLRLLRAAEAAYSDEKQEEAIPCQLYKILFKSLTRGITKRYQPFRFLYSRRS